VSNAARKSIWPKVAAWGGLLYVAIQLHAFLGIGGWVVGDAHVDKVALLNLGKDVRERVRQSEQTFDLDGTEYGVKPNDVAPDKPPPPPPPKIAKKEEKKKPDPLKPPTPEQKKPEEKKIPLLVKTDKKNEPVPVQPVADKRIAVKQHAQPNQEDNPNAHFIADQANHVDQESVATQTSHDQDDELPTPGGNHSNADKRMGDSDKTKIAESEDHDGEKNKAPGEKGTEHDVRDPNPLRPMSLAMLTPPLQPPVAGGDGKSPSSNNNSNNPNAPAAGDEAANPDVASADNGNWTFNPLRPGAVPALSAHPCPNATADHPCQSDGSSTDENGHPRSSISWMGLGGTPGPGQVNLNLNQQGVVAIVGQDQLRKEREADGERRKSEHRGSWTASNFEKWRSAIENYVSSVKPGNTTALNTAAVPFATYLNGMHNRIHPIFADTFLGSLDSLPGTHPMNDPKIFTSLEIVLTREGQIVKMGVVKTSGITAFDIAALDSVQRASPFGPAPGAIISPDGNVYLHWEFHRDEQYACSTMNARPIMLKSAPSGPTTPNPLPVPPTTPPTQERGMPTENSQDTREGNLALPLVTDPRG
jgi:TonB family protein